MLNYFARLLLAGSAVAAAMGSAMTLRIGCAVTATSGRAAAARTGSAVARTGCAVAAAFGFALVSGSTFAQAPTPGDGAGWTGVGHPADVIAARQALMQEIERLMRPIDTYAADKTIEPSELTDAAATIAPMLLAAPHLFPPTTNLYDPEANAPATLALPAIWQDFSTFYELSSAASAAAVALAATTDANELRGSAAALRASCDACHALYLRPYVPAEVSEEDLEFDFDSLFPAD